MHDGRLRLQLRQALANESPALHAPGPGLMKVFHPHHQHQGLRRQVGRQVTQAPGMQEPDLATLDLRGLSRARGPGLRRRALQHRLWHSGPGRGQRLGCCACEPVARH